MKKLILLISGIVLSATVSTTSAQQLPNNGFEDWETAGNTYQSNKAVTGGAAGNKARPGTEPVSWEGSSVHQTVLGVTKKETLVTQGSDNTNYVILTNKFVGALGVGSNAPGFMSFATPWVYAKKDISACDGGVFGGMEFAYRPDAVVGKFKRTDSNTENSHIIAYLWNGTFKSNIKSDSSPDEKEDVDRAVLASAGIDDVPTTTTSPDGTGTLVAYCDYKFKSTTDSKWQTIEVPLKYVNTSVDPQKINVILSAADYWTRAKIQENTSLCVDDVKLVYYSRLKSVLLGGYNVPLTDGVYDYVAYVGNPTSCNATVLGGAPTKTVTKSNDTANNIYSITVTNNTAGDNATDIDGKKSHTYNFKYMSQKTGHIGVMNLPEGTFKFGPKKILVDYIQEADGTYALSFGDPDGEFEIDGGFILDRTLIKGVTMTVDSDGYYVFTKDGVTDTGDYAVSLVNDGSTKCIYDTVDGRWIFNFDVNVNGKVTRVTVTSDTTLSGVNGMNEMNERVVARRGAIEVSGFDGVAEVYTVDGRLVAKTTVAGNAQIAASHGIYLVRTPNTVKKVVVR